MQSEENTYRTAQATFPLDEHRNFFPTPEKQTKAGELNKY